MRRVMPPARFGGNRLDPASDAPAHGEHTAEILAELGRSESDIADLAAGAIAKPAD